MEEKYPVMVSIECCVYNHEPYLRQCLDGFVMQKTNFPFEAIVHDDASTDGSASIILEYAERYPDIIKPIIETENQYSKKDGSLRNILNAHLSGKYIAWCEGDDYWIDPLKLQKQVEYLESHEDCGIVYSKAKRWNEEQKTFGPSVGHEVRDFHELIKKNVIPTLTVMFRRSLVTDYWEMIKDKNWLMGDYPLWLYLSSLSRIHFFDETFGVYREHGGSATHKSDIQTRERFTESIRDIQMFFCQMNNIDPSFVDDVYYNNLYFNAIYFKDYKRAFSYYEKVMHPSVKLFLSYVKNRTKMMFQKA